MKEENIIKVENISGPILLLSAKDDAQWTSVKMGEAICQRLNDRHFQHMYKHKIFNPASHLLSPIHSALRLAYRQERKYRM